MSEHGKSGMHHINQNLCMSQDQNLCMSQDQNLCMSRDQNLCMSGDQKFLRQQCVEDLVTMDMFYKYSFSGLSFSVGSMVA